MKDIVNKIALDRNGKKLGLIIDVVGSDKSVIKIKKLHAIIHVRLLLEVKDFKIPIELEKITKIEEKNIWFDILKADFKRILKELRTDQAIKAKEAKAKDVEAEREYITKMSGRNS
ncbi:MAG TPA: hypothetical protein VMZ29_12885 [Candidatus Bathyarchaeia archaeon]|nr:hypothetical protein [Candidatus Bathyarchaeia archaeon]